LLEQFRPISAVLVLWPTPEFEFPEDHGAFAQRLRAVFPAFNEHRLFQAAQGALPPELPRVALTGDRRRWTLELAPARITLARNLQGLTPAEAGLDTLLRELREQAGRVQAWLAENLNLRVYRIGLVVQFFCNTRSSANEKIAQYFLQPRALQGQTPHELNLGLLNRLALADNVVVNRWLRVRPLRTNDARRLDFAAQIELDYNTLPEDTRQKTAREVAEFIQAAERNMQDDIPVFNDVDFLGPR